MLERLREKIGAIWCSLAHESPMWPLHGHYECRTCGRRFPAFTEASIARWANQPAAPGATAVTVRPATASLGHA